MIKPKRYLSGLLAGVLFSALSSQLLANNAVPMKIDIKPQSTATALLELAERAGVQIIFPEGLGESSNAPAVNGYFTINQALDALLEDTDLSYHFTSEDMVVIQVKDGDEMAMASADNYSSSSDEGKETVDSRVIEEILVTAEKRAESLKDVPMSISAYTGETLDERGITEVFDLARQVPSLQFGEDRLDNYVSIRGVGHGLAGIGAEPGVTISQDGVPFSSPVLFDADFLDVERIEVLRGPQGTIAGRNSTGGSINIISKRPIDGFEAGAKMTAGNYNRFALEGYLNSPLAEDKVLARLAVRSEDADGWLENTYLNEDLNSKDKIMMRASFLTTFSETFDAHLILQHTIDRSVTAVVSTGQVRPDIPSVADFNNIPDSDVENLETQANFPTRNFRKRDDKAILNMSWQLADNATVSSITGYVDFEAKMGNFDGDGSILDLWLLSPSIQTVNGWSQELTLAMDITDRVDLIFGGLYLQSDVRGYGAQALPAFGYGVPDLAFFDGEQDLTSKAVYGQLRFNVTDKLRLTVGGRYTHDTKDYAYAALLADSPQGSVSGDAFTPRVAIDYSPGDDVTLYLTASRGFKSGGHNSFSPNDYDPEFVWNYEAGVKANMFDRRLTTALSVFYMDYTDLQQTIHLPNPAFGGVPTAFLRNTGDATISGVELEVDVHLTEQFRLTFAGSYLDATYDDLSSVDPVYPELGEQSFVGKRISRTPKFQFNIGGEYWQPLSENVQAVLRTNYSWQDDVFFTIYSNPYHGQEAYGLLELSGALEDAGGRWAVTVFARNLLDERYISNMLDNTNIGGGVRSVTGQIGSPRMYGVSLEYNF